VAADATESAVRSKAGQASIIHLAAHGEFNPYNPLFSAIHLAGDAQNDGRLEAHEVYGLDLTAATELVVLSACQTNVGAVSAGDEVVGLNRAFIYAGTPTVIASLWNVDDAATALIMERFYTHLRSGANKGEALRQAQIEVRAKYPHPFYWAAFVLTGDADSTVQVKPTPPWSLILGATVIGGAFLIFVTRAVAMRRRQKRVDSSEMRELD
jgi:CHAT domain-containing protein